MPKAKHNPDIRVKSIYRNKTIKKIINKSRTQSMAHIFQRMFHAVKHPNKINLDSPWILSWNVTWKGGLKKRQRVTLT